MSDEHKIVQQVYAAKEDIQAADQPIGTYMPFVKAETAKFLKRPPIEGHDDDLSIAMIAFHEVIGGYSRTRGYFLKYASMLIKSRLIDYSRKEQRHSNLISLDTPAGEEEKPLGETLADEKNNQEEIVSRDATRLEIEELSRQMKEFGVSLSDVADNCPKQQRKLEACRNALQYAKENPELLDELLQTKRLPIVHLTAGSGVERKTLVIYTNGYEIIRGHLKQVMKGVAAR